MTAAEGTADHDVDRQVVDLLFALIGTMRRHFVASIAELGLTPPQAHALRRLDSTRALPMRELAADLMCDPSTVTGIVDGLEERGLVERRPALDDRRIKAIIVTESGIAARERLHELIVTKVSPLSGLTADERVILRDLLAKAVGQPV